MGCVRVLIVREEGKNSIILELRVQPGASKTRTKGFETDSKGVERLKLYVSTRPVDGAANIAVIEWVANFFGIPKRDVALTRGQKSRSKSIKINGSAADLIARAQSLIGDK